MVRKVATPLAKSILGTLLSHVLYWALLPVAYELCQGTWEEFSGILHALAEQSAGRLQDMQSTQAVGHYSQRASNDMF